MDTTDKAAIDERISFGELNRKVTSTEFTGGRIECSFGSAKIDLTQATIHSRGAELRINCSFGGVEIRVPKHAAIKTEGQSLVGGWEERFTHEGRPDAPVLKITGSVSFGGVVLKD